MKSVSSTLSCWQHDLHSSQCGTWGCSQRWTDVRERTLFVDNIICCISIGAVIQEKPTVSKESHHSQIPETLVGETHPSLLATFLLINLTKIGHRSEYYLMATLTIDSK